ncbi:hypothetical protein OROHE_024851 [Orobanche hederae]
MAENIEPLLAEVQDSGLLKDVESLTKTLTRASEDFRLLNISSDILGFTGNEATRKNLKLLIKSLSRLL